MRRRLPPDFDRTPQRPAYGDVLGILESWTDGVLAVRRADGQLIRIAEDDVVAGKPIPPRPERRTPIGGVATGERLAVRTCDGWPAPEVEHLGEWRLRAAEGFTGRANSALVVGSPGIGLDDALTRVRGFYAARGLPPWAQLIIGSAYEDAFAERGWRIVSRGSGGPAGQTVLVQVAELETLRGRLGAPTTHVALTSQLSDAWYQRYRPGEAISDAARHVLTAPERVVLASIGQSEVSAIGRGVVTGDWLGIAALTVAPEHRRRGLASAILAALVGWGGEHQASRVYVQVGAENDAALRMYERLGFRTDHAYRYYTVDDESAAC